MVYFWDDESNGYLVNHYSVVSCKFVSENILDPENQYSYLIYTLRQMGFVKYKGGKRITVNGRRVGNIWYNKHHFGGREPTRDEIKEYLNQYMNYGIDFYTATKATREEWGKRVKEDRELFTALVKAEDALEEKKLEEVAKSLKELRKVFFLRYREDRI